MHTITRFECSVLTRLGHIVDVKERRAIVIVNGLERYKLVPNRPRPTLNQAIQEMRRVP